MTQDKIYVKRMVSKVVFISIGAHMIYKFYRMTGLATRLENLFFLKDNNQEQILDECGCGVKTCNECTKDLEVIESVGSLVSLKTIDDVWLHFKERGEYKICYNITHGIIKGDVKVVFNDNDKINCDMKDKVFEIPIDVKKINII